MVHKAYFGCVECSSLESICNMNVDPYVSVSLQDVIVCCFQKEYLWLQKIHI